MVVGAVAASERQSIMRRQPPRAVCGRTAKGDNRMHLDTPKWWLFVVAYLVVHLPGLSASSFAEEPPVDPKPLAPAGGRDDGDPGPAVIVAAQAFLRAVHQSDDVAAYALTTAAFQKATPREQFAERLKALRETNSVADKTPLGGWVVVKSQDGKPRRALLATIASSMRSFLPPPAPGGPNRARLSPAGIELIEQDGRWLVADARNLKEPGEGPRPFARPGQEPNAYAEPIRAKEGRDGSAREVTTAVKGILTEVKADSITLKGEFPVKPGAVDTASGERTFKIDDATSVTLAVDSGRTLPDGRKVHRVTYRFGPASALLRAGYEATVEPGQGDGGAVNVLAIQPPDGPGL
jgi:hypothetical protein